MKDKGKVRSIINTHLGSMTQKREDNGVGIVQYCKCRHVVENAR